MSIYLNDSFSILLLINFTTIIFSSLSIIFGVIFVSIILFNRSYRTIANLLTVNSSISIILLTISTLSISIYGLNRDIKEYRSDIQIPMGNLVLCHIRTYLAHLSFFALIYSYVIQALYRLVGTKYYHRISYQNWKIYTWLIIIEWIASLIQLIPIGLGNHQIYLQEEFLCQMKITNSKIMTYLSFTNYLIPLTIILIIYILITKSMKEKENNGTHRYNIHRTHRQMVLTRRILILIGILLILGGPYSSFVLMETFSIGHAPIYSHRIGFMCISISGALSILMISYFTRSTHQMMENFLLKRMKFNWKNDSYRLSSSRNYYETPPERIAKTTNEENQV